MINGSKLDQNERVKGKTTEAFININERLVYDISVISHKV